MYVKDYQTNHPKFILEIFRKGFENEQAKALFWIIRKKRWLNDSQNKINPKYKYIMVG